MEYKELISENGDETVVYRISRMRAIVIKPPYTSDIKNGI